MPSHPYIAFEGPIAAGKTTVATLLATHLNSELLLEEFQNNEFLADFYAAPERWSLPMQLWFLTSRIGPLKSIYPPRGKTLVADYTARKDRLFARLLLKDRELNLFDRIAGLLAIDLPQPNLIVYLDANDTELLARIKNRGRPYEQKIDDAYLSSLRVAYDDDLVASGVKILRYDTSALDLRCERQLHELYDLILSSAADG
jgi:deoxyadenosine/deoxycytidine kinase